MAYTDGWCYFCECCGQEQPELTEYGDTCPYCGWQHDSVDEDCPDRLNGPNHVTLYQARWHYRLTGSRLFTVTRGIATSLGWHYCFPNHCACCQLKQPKGTVYGDVCAACGWIHDMIDEEHPDDTWGANRFSLNRYRANFRLTHTQIEDDNQPT